MEICDSINKNIDYPGNADILRNYFQWLNYILDRPVIPLLLAFICGVFVAHYFICTDSDVILSVFPAASVCLIATVFLSGRIKTACLLLSFFFVGLLLDSNSHKLFKFSFLAEHQPSLVIEGTVLGPVSVYKDTGRFEVCAHLYISGKEAAFINENLLVVVYKNTPELYVGEKIRFPAKLKKFRNFNNPGRYDYEYAMKLKDMACSASVSDGQRIVPMGKGHLPLREEIFERFRKHIRVFFKKNLKDQNIALYSALILGENQVLTPDLREPFNITGLGHILAVSGLHIGLVAMSVFFCLKWMLSRFYSLALRINLRKTAAMLTCFPVVAYAFIAGLQISSQRAMIMIIVFLMSMVLEREKDIWSTIAFAALIILFIDPHAIFGMSFLLSFTAVIGIIWISPFIIARIPYSKNENDIFLNRFAGRIYYYFLGLTATCISAFIVLMPFVISFFHSIPVTGIPANISVVPVLGLWVIPCGLLSVLCLPFSNVLSGLLLNFGESGLDIMMWLIRFWAGFSWSRIWVVTPSYFEMLLYFSFLFVIFSKNSIKKRSLFLCLIIITLIDAGYWIKRVYFNDRLIVTFIDVGQASAALVEFPGGEKMLIDGGGFPGDRFDVGQMVIAPFLWVNKISRIDYVVLSHPQADHLNGLRFIVGNFHPKEFWFNGDYVHQKGFLDLMGIINSLNIIKRTPRDLPFETFINGAVVTVLSPFTEINVAEKAHPEIKKNLNNDSLVLKVTYGSGSVLFPGDIEFRGEQTLIQNMGDNLKSDILLSPHHGSKTSNSNNFLEAVRPDICIISSGKGNSFGFPHDETLKRLRNHKIRVIRMDKYGAVKCIMSEKKIEIRTFSDLNELS